MWSSESANNIFSKRGAASGALQIEKRTQQWISPENGLQVHKLFSAGAGVQVTTLITEVVDFSTYENPRVVAVQERKSGGHDDCRRRGIVPDWNNGVVFVRSERKETGGNRRIRETVDWTGETADEQQKERNRQHCLHRRGHVTRLRSARQRTRYATDLYHTQRRFSRLHNTRAVGAFLVVNKKPNGVVDTLAHTQARVCYRAQFCSPSSATLPT